MILVLLIIGMTAGVSISELFTAAITPGLILVTLFISYILIRCYINPELGPPAPKSEAINRKEKLGAVGHILLPNGMFL